MLRFSHIWCAVAVLYSMAGDATAQELKSGLAAGRTMISLPIEKIAGADDGVNAGDTICYT